MLKSKDERSAIYRRARAEIAVTKIVTKTSIIAENAIAEPSESGNMTEWKRTFRAKRISTNRVIRKMLSEKAHNCHFYVIGSKSFSKTATEIAVRHATRDIYGSETIHQIIATKVRSG